MAQDCFSSAQQNPSPTSKIKLDEKLLVFNELIKGLVEWKTKENGQKEEEVLKDLSYVPLMKCLYFVCLLSVHKNKDKSLFNLFDNFLAYEKGAVEIDCYKRINELLDYYENKESRCIGKR